MAGMLKQLMKGYTSDANERRIASAISRFPKEHLGQLMEHLDLERLADEVDSNKDRSQIIKALTAAKATSTCQWSGVATRTTSMSLRPSNSRKS